MFGLLFFLWGYRLDSVTSFHAQHGKLKEKAYERLNKHLFHRSQSGALWETHRHRFGAVIKSASSYILSRILCKHKRRQLNTHKAPFRA